jgi:hypothetical protein
MGIVSPEIPCILFFYAENCLLSLETSGMQGSDRIASGDRSLVLWQEQCEESCFEHQQHPKVCMILVLAGSTSPRRRLCVDALAVVDDSILVTVYGRVA